MTANNIIVQKKLGASERAAAECIADLLERHGVIRDNKIELRHVHVIEMVNQPRFVRATVHDVQFGTTMGTGTCWLDEDGEPTKVRFDLAGGWSETREV